MEKQSPGKDPLEDPDADMDQSCPEQRFLDSFEGMEVIHNYGESSCSSYSEEFTDFNPSTSNPKKRRAVAMQASYCEDSSSDDESKESESKFTEFDSSQEITGTSMLQCEDASSTQQKRKSDRRAQSKKAKSEGKCTSFTTKNYCCVCGKVMSKIARHLARHAEEDPEIAEAFAFPKKSRKRKMLLDRLRNKGNYIHNQEVLRNKSGALKLRRRPISSKNEEEDYKHCPYCKGMLKHKDMYKHVAKCVWKMAECTTSGNTQVLNENTPESEFEQKIPPGVKKILSAMPQDEIALVIQHDSCLVQLAQSLLEKYGNDLSKSNYIQKKLRAMGGLLLELHKKTIVSFEDAIQPKNFYKVINTVKDIAGFDFITQKYTKRGLALELGCTLKRMGSLVLAGAEDENTTMRNAQAFVELCENEWANLGSEKSISSLCDGKVRSPSTIPFTCDVQAFYKHLEKLSASATESLMASDNTQIYSSLCRVTLAQASVLNKCLHEVSKMTLKCFQERADTTQVLSKHFIRINILSKTGHRIAVLLTSQLVNVLTLLISKRSACGVHEENPFLFAKPDRSATSHYHGENCIRSYSSSCLAKNPEHLRLMHLHKHIARIFQILNLENDELDHLAKLLGHNIRTDRDYYRSPEAAVELAKIAKLLLAMEKGSLERFKGNSLEEVEIEDELEPDVEHNPGNTDAEERNGELDLLLQQSDEVGQHSGRLTPADDALQHIKARRDKPFLQEKFIDPFKGRGVFTSESIEPSTFVVEYRGNIFPRNKTYKRTCGDSLNNYLFEFSWNGTDWCIDAFEEDGTLGRLVNDENTSPNCKVKKIVYDGKPHLCLFALKKISPGEEITFDYGSSSYPWRPKKNSKEANASQMDVNATESCPIDEVIEDSVDISSYADFSGDEYISDEEADAEDIFSESEDLVDPSYTQQDDQDSISEDSDFEAKPKDCASTKRNYCYVCEKPQSKISRHLFTHREEEPDIAEAFALRRKSKERKKLLEILRNRGNHKHNQKVLKTRKGKLKLNKRRDQATLVTTAVCIYCKQMFGRKSFWRHMQRCPLKVSDPPTGVSNQILALVATGLTDPDHISSGVRKMLKKIKEDDVGSIIRKDSYLLQLAQCLYYMNEAKSRDSDIGRCLRQMGKVLLVLQENSIFSFEDAMKPQNFDSVVEAVKKLASVNKEEKTCKRLMSYMGNSLNKIANIKYARTLNNKTDKETLQEVEEFMKLCAKEWRTATPLQSKGPSQPTIAFTRDVQVFYKYTENTVTSAVKTLSRYQSAPVYTALLRGIVVYVAILNRNIVEAPEVTLKSFQERNETEPQEDAAICQPNFEQILSKNTVKISVVSQKGKTVSLILTPDLLSAIKLLVEKRSACGVAENNPYLFAKPGTACLTFLKERATINSFVSWCGAESKEGLRSKFFRKHIARVFQILILGNDELCQLAKLLGRDIRTEREFYQTPEAAADIARILELLSTLKSESLERFEGKSLEEIEIPDAVQPAGEQDSEAEDGESANSLQKNGSSFSKGFFSSAKRKSRGSAKKQDRTKKKRPENKETDAVNTENNGHSEETPLKNAVNPSEETNSGSKESGFNMYFSDNDEDMNVDFDIDSDAGDDSQMRNEENDAEDAADSDGEDMTPEHSNRHDRKRKAPSVSENSDKIMDAVANPVEEKVSDEGRDKGEAELSAWLDVNSNDSFSSLCTEKKNLSPASVEMKKVKIVIPKLNLAALQASVHISQLPLMNKPPVKVQPTTNTKSKPEAATMPAETTNKPNSAKAVNMICSHCKKNMTKGQTAFQKKGFTDVFCSKNCLFEMFPFNKTAMRTCHHCCKEICQPLDLIMAVVDLKGTTKDFCSPACLLSFKSNTHSIQSPRSPRSWSRTMSTQTPPSLCSTCSKTCTTTLELALAEAFHNFCSDTCLEGFCRDNVGVCDNCSSTCRKMPLRLKWEDGTKTLCCGKCLQTFKDNIETLHQCALCNSSQPVSEMVVHKNRDNTVELFCSQHCVRSYKLSPIILQRHQGRKDSTSANQFNASLSENTPRPVVSTSDVLCSNCRKKLVRGCTLYQLKSTKEVFCTVACVSEKHPHIDSKKCHNCSEVIMRPQNMILSPVDDTGTMMELCSNACLALVKSKRTASAKQLQQKGGPSSVCKMCAQYCYCKFKVSIDGEIHSLCSDSCFTNYHRINKIPYANCDMCAAVCPNKEFVVELDDDTKAFCGDGCLAKFKEKVVDQQCTTCHTSHQMSDMLENKNPQGKIAFFCSHRCLMMDQTQSFSVSEKKSSSVDEADFKEVKPLLPCLESIKLKEEPLDEEYSQNLATSVSPQSIKDEPKAPKEELVIDSVFSLVEDSKPTQPDLTPVDLPSSCSNCNNVLMDGETVYQRKGRAEIFCSTPCLLKYYQTKSAENTCHFCLRGIKSEKALQAAVDDDGTKKNFCSQICLSSFNYKTMVSNKTPAKQFSVQSQCSVCTKSCISKQEIILNEAVHKICSEPCLHRFSNINNLHICDNCHSCCSTWLTLNTVDGNKTLCGGECLAQYKQKIQTPQQCTMCCTSRPVSDMIENKNREDVVELFCTSSCMMASKIQDISASGVTLNCDNCSKMTKPACHLAMSDASIRNFCTLTCAMSYKETQKDLTSASEPAGPDNQSQSDFDKPKDELLCAQCGHIIRSTPKVIQEKDRLSFVCSDACSQEFKRVNDMISKCDLCKNNRIVRVVKRVDKKDLCFCSDRCKKRFGNELKSKWGKHCRSCAFCLSVSKTVVTKQKYGSKEFCSDDCIQKYKMLINNEAKCDTCGQQGNLKQSLPLLGDVKHFCNLTCLFHFSSKNAPKVDAGSTSPRSACAVESSPVITNVISLSSSLSAQPSASEGCARLGPFTDIQTKVVGHASIQTVPKELKNKSMLCIPLVHNKGVSCTMQTVERGMQTAHFKEKACPKPSVLPVPVPVPVYVPVPMNMYHQYTPNPVGLPIPLLVPVFLPEKPGGFEPTVTAMKEGTLIQSVKANADENETEDWEEDTIMTEDESEKTQSAVDHTSSQNSNLDTSYQLSLNNQKDFISDTNSTLFSQPQPHKILAPVSDLTSNHLPDLSSQNPRGSSTPLPSPPLVKLFRVKVHKKNQDWELQHSSVPEEDTSQGGLQKVIPRKPERLKSQCGVDAWRRWIQWRESQTKLGLVSPSDVRLKAEILRCSSVELNEGLCLFINELKQQQRELHSPDGLFYLCLSIQQYLFENGRVENIFSDRIYQKFSTEFTKILKLFRPSLTSSGYVHFQVEEKFLWDCKQLGAYSPIVLLNTLLFFCCKYFGLTTVEQHRQLSFTNLRCCIRTNSDNSETTVVRFYPPASRTEATAGASVAEDADVPAKKRKLNEHEEDFLDITENVENPLRCPVRLFEFYFSKCSPSVKRRNDVFYLLPDRSCAPSHPLWFSSTPLDDASMEAMIVRTLIVQELKGEDRGGTK